MERHSFVCHVSLTDVAAGKHTVAFWRIRSQPGSTDLPPDSKLVLTPVDPMWTARTNRFIASAGGLPTKFPTHDPTVKNVEQYIGGELTAIVVRFPTKTADLGTSVRMPWRALHGAIASCFDVVRAVYVYMDTLGQQIPDAYHWTYRGSCPTADPTCRAPRSRCCYALFASDVAFSAPHASVFFCHTPQPRVMMSVVYGTIPSQKKNFCLRQYIPQSNKHQSIVKERCHKCGNVVEAGTGHHVPLPGGERQSDGIPVFGLVCTDCLAMKFQNNVSRAVRGTSRTLAVPDDGSRETKHIEESPSAAESGVDETFIKSLVWGNIVNPHAHIERMHTRHEGNADGVRMQPYPVPGAGYTSIQPAHPSPQRYAPYPRPAPAVMDRLTGHPHASAPHMGTSECQIVPAPVYASSGPLKQNSHPALKSQAWRDRSSRRGGNETPPSSSDTDDESEFVDRFGGDNDVEKNDQETDDDTEQDEEGSSTEDDGAEGAENIDEDTDSFDDARDTTTEDGSDTDEHT